ncbi:MAG: transporter [Gammaproteobacteria bacterium]|nr:transporter [Gammaproteobacteria bacterium]
MSRSAVAGLLLWTLATSSHAAPQTFNTALPVAKGEFVLREQLFSRRARDGPNTANRDFHARGIISVLGRGVARNFAVFGALPYLDTTLDFSAPGGPVHRNTTGIGDVRLFGRYTFHQQNSPGRTFRIAAVFGVEMPTGDHDQSDSLGRLPAPLQLGSGTWDPFGGIVLTYQTLKFEVDAQASYKINTTANDFEFGDEARLDVSFQYRLWPRVLDDSGVPGYLYGVLEGSVRNRAKNKINAVPDPNSGGTSVYLSPGIQYVTKRWILEGIVEVPLAQDLGGTALEDDYILRIGIRVNF